ncbi:MAG: O-antigen translocase [Jhaorihella sp.]
MSSRDLVKSMLMIGSAQAVSVVISVLRVKVLALLVGPAGIGLLGIYQNLRETGALGAGLGLQTSGVREIASARGEAETLARVRRVLAGALLVQGAVAMALIWLLRERLAVWLAGDPGHAAGMGLVGAAVFLTLANGSQLAILRGMRRIGDLARVTIHGALAGTAAGLAAVWFMGMDGLIWLILAQPMASILVAALYMRRLPHAGGARLGPGGFMKAWWPMVTLGSVFMASGLVGAMILLAVRGLISRDLGLAATGQFAAAWGMSAVYLGLLLNAMSADYLPRMTEIVHNREAVVTLMNDQIQVALALGGPMLLLLIGCAPWVVELLYSAQFADAVTLLQWQTLGNVFKIAAWPLGFAFVAAARSGVFLFNQVLWNALFLALGWLGLPHWGIDAFGVSFLVAFGIGLAVNAVLVRRHFGFRWQALSRRLLGMHAVLALGLFALAQWVPVAAAVAAIVIACLTGLIGGHVVASKVGTSGRLASRLAGFYAAIGWPVRESS